MAIEILYDDEAEEFRKWQQGKEERERAEAETRAKRADFDYQNKLDAAFGLDGALRTAPKTETGRIAQIFCKAGDDSWIAEDIKAEADAYGVHVSEIADYGRYMAKIHGSGPTNDGGGL